MTDAYGLPLAVVVDDIKLVADTPDGNSRRMCNGPICVPYGLYQDASHSTVWNDTTEVQSQISTTGSAQSLVVYGAIPVQNWPKPGAYQDTVVVTLSY